MSKNMDDFLDEYLFEKKSRLNYNNLKEEIEQEVSDDEEINPVKEDYVFEATLDVNNSEATVRLERGEFARRAITDFVSVITLFKNSKEIPVKDFLTSIGIGPQSSTGEPVPTQDQTDMPEKPDDSNEITPDSTSDETTALDTNKTEPKESEFKLNSFSLSTKETSSQDDQNQVSINGVENINQALSFKIIVNTDSSAFNTPESALSYFNQVFFDNIIKTIDKEVEDNS